jgi:hypothetical protein
MAQNDMIRDWNDLEALHTGQFVPGPLYSPEADVLRVAIGDEPDWCEHLDRWLGVKRSSRSHAVTGCTLHAVRHRLLPIVRMLALDDGGEEVTVKALLLAAIIAAAEEGGPAQLKGRGYLEALAPICRAVGPMKVDFSPQASS